MNIEDKYEQIAIKGQALLEEHGKNALFHAVSENDMGILDWLKEHHVDINACDPVNDDTVMHMAARHDAEDALVWLKDEGMNIDSKNLQGMTPMHEAARNNALDAMTWLKDEGADINARDNMKNTPMHYAASCNSMDPMEWLIKQGADINARNVRGKIPMDYKDSEHEFENLNDNESPTPG